MSAYSDVIRKPDSFPLAYRLVLAASTAFALLFVPTAIAESLEHMADWSHVLTHPIEEFALFAHAHFPNSLGRLSLLQIKVVYCSVVLATFAWYSFGSLNFFDRQAQHLAAAFAEILGRKSEAENLLNPTASRSTAASVAAGGAALAGGAAAATALPGILGGILAGGVPAGLLPVAAGSGPPGWLIFGGLVLAAIAAKALLSDNRRAAAVQIDDATRARLEAQLRDAEAAEKVAQEFWWQFQQRREEELQRIFLTGALLTAIVIYTFAAPYISDHLGR